MIWGASVDMRILYVTPLWSGFRDILLDGAMDAKGMPAFIQPLKRLIKLGHEVDIIIAEPNISKNDLNISVDWLERTRITFTNWDTKSFNRIFSSFKLYSVVNCMLNKNEYDFVYGHGSIGAIANIAANLNGIPCGIRLYGTFLAREIKHISKTRIAMKHLLEYMSFKLPKDFLLVTNDGTRGDQVYDYLTNQRAKYKFCFMLNGVDMPEPFPDDIAIVNQLKIPFIVYPARIARWKRQHLAVDILKGLHDNGVPMNLYFAGHITDTYYWNEVERKITDYGLTPFVTYLGTVDNRVLHCLYQKAVAVLSLYELSNLGNVVIEALKYGAVVVSVNDGSLDQFVVNGENGILVENLAEAVNQIHFIYKNKNKSLEIRESAIHMASEVFKDWDTRAEEEIQLIESAVIYK